MDVTEFHLGGCHFIRADFPDFSSSRRLSLYQDLYYQGLYIFKLYTLFKQGKHGLATTGDMYKSYGWTSSWLDITSPRLDLALVDNTLSREIYSKPYA
jgi:hypothetical protein